MQTISVAEGAPVNKPTSRVALVLAIIMITSGCYGSKLSEPPANAHRWAELGEKNILMWSPEEQRLGYPNIRQINPVRELTASQTPKVFSTLPWEDVGLWLEAMEDMSLAGLIIVHNGEIKFESYREGHSAQDRWMSFSITKSVVSMLYGIALAEGLIGSLDETVAQHLPQFEGTGYATVTLRNLLQMSSGVAWNEDYQDPASDVARLDNATEAEVLAHLASLPLIHEPGEVFNYNTGETTLAGAILGRSIGMPLTDYLEKKIWHPFGMEHGADWALMGPGGAEMGGCCISASLRDYARLGWVALEGSNDEGLLPKGWMRESTLPSSGADYYGYFWWLEAEEDFRAVGIFGQNIYISPRHNLVIATHGLWPSARSDSLSAKRSELISSIKRAVAQSASD